MINYEGDKMVQLNGGVVSPNFASAWHLWVYNMRLHGPEKTSLIHT